MAVEVPSIIWPPIVLILRIRLAENAGETVKVVQGVVDAFGSRSILGSWPTRTNNVAKKMKTIQDEKFEVFFDAQCPLCKKEIDMVRRMDVNQRLILTDIAAEDFDPSSVGKSLDTLMREIHGRHADGSWVVGVEVFREIYGRVGFEKLASISKWPIVRSLLDLGYTCFAWPRYRLALRRMKKTQRSSAGKTDAALCDASLAESSCRQIASATKPTSSPADRPEPVSAAATTD